MYVDDPAVRNGRTHDLTLWQYAMSIGKTAADIDALYGWPAGTSAAWAKANNL
jgi:hypothetical protein